MRPFPGQWADDSHFVVWACRGGGMIAESSSANIAGRWAVRENYLQAIPHPTQRSRPNRSVLVPLWYIQCTTLAR